MVDTTRTMICYPALKKIIGYLAKKIELFKIYNRWVGFMQEKMHEDDFFMNM